MADEKDIHDVIREEEEAYEEKEAAAKKKKSDGNKKDSDDSSKPATSRGGSTFSPKVVIENVKSPHFWGWVAAIFVFLLIAWYFDFLRFRTMLLNFGFTILGLVTVLVMICFILYGFATCKGNPAKGFIAAALLIWMLDLVPENFWLIGQYLGPVYQGFEFPFLAIDKSLELLIFPILASSFFFALFYANMVYNIIKKEYVFFLLSFGLIIISNYLSNQLPTYLRFSLTIPWGKIGFFIVLVLLGWLAWKRDRQRAETEIAGFFTYLYMAFVLSFFWLNTGWQGNVRAWIHAVYIIAFGFGYIKPMSKTPYVWHLLIPSLLLLDFYGYGFLYSTDILALQFIPPLVIFVIWFCYEKETEKGTENYNYPVAAFILLITFILLMSVSVAGATSAEVPFVARKGVDFKELSSQFTNKIKDLVEGRLITATGGYWTGNVENNRYESLGVYFSNIRAADPKFYDDEPITVWGSIRSKTYKDAVIINFSCYRTKDSKRIKADRIIPATKFPIFSLEEADTECTFLPKTEKELKISTGSNIITFSAEYNFGTDAYIKAYFMDRDRYRAYVREGIDDPLKEFGIKDKNPAAVFTNGPVQIGITTGQPIITVSEGFAIKPSIGITLTNRQEIQDKDKKVITRWEGKIKNITELILLAPPGIEIPKLALEKCKLPLNDPARAECPCSMPFKPYEIGECKKTCETEIFDGCAEACRSVYPSSNAESERNRENRVSCDIECQTTAENCIKECDLLFDSSSETQQGKYKGYALDVGSLQFKDLNKDIDKHRSFVCRFDSSTAVLDNTPITTRYFRVRARYNYLLENSIPINVVSLPAGIPSSSQKSLYDNAVAFSQPGSKVYFTGLTPDLIAAIAHVETGQRHCCQEAGKTSAKTCLKSEEKKCPREKTITSGTSYGIMQVRYDTAKVQKEVNALVTEHCSSGETIFDFDCNQKVGMAILKKKYDAFKDGCKETREYKSGDKVTYKTLIDGCENGITSTGVRYDSYRRVEAAVRGYNGWGRDSRFDVNYVDKVKSALEKIKNGQIIDATGAQALFSSREGEGMAGEIVEGEFEGGNKPVPPEPLGAQYNPSGKSITLAWTKSSSPSISNYIVTRYDGNEARLVCDVQAIDEKATYSCIDPDPNVGTTTPAKSLSTYTIMAYSDRYGYSDEVRFENQ